MESVPSWVCHCNIYGKSEKISKLSNGNTHFFLYWNVISIVKNPKYHSNGNYTTKITRVRQGKSKKDVYFLDRLTYYAIPELQRQNALSEVVIMQDGASPRVGSSVKRLSSQQFGDGVISRHFLFPWPPRSSDLTAMDFLQWGYGESKVHQFHPQTVSDLKDATRTAIQEIPIALDTICSAIHHLPDAKCHCVWRRSCGKIVKHNKILYFMLLLCCSWLFSLLTYLAPVIFVLQLSFECWSFPQWRLHSNAKKWVLPFEILEIFSL